VLDTNGEFQHPIHEWGQIWLIFVQILAKEFNRSINARDGGKHVILYSSGLNSSNFSSHTR